MSTRARDCSRSSQLVSRVQVIPVVIVGEWDFPNERRTVFVIENVDKIVTSFEQNL